MMCSYQKEITNDLCLTYMCISACYSSQYASGGLFKAFISVFACMIKDKDSLLVQLCKSNFNECGIWLKLFELCNSTFKTSKYS